MKKLILVIATVVLCGLTDLRAQYHNYSTMSGSERRAYTRELLDIEPSDMRLSTSEILNYKKEMNAFGTALKEKSPKEFWWGLGIFILGPTVMSIPAIAADAMTVLYVGAPLCMAAGGYLVIKSVVDTNRGQTLLDKSRLLIAQSSTYPFEFNLDGVELALGISTTCNISDFSRTLGPGISIRF